MIIWGTGDERQDMLQKVHDIDRTHSLHPVKAAGVSDRVKSRRRAF
jgi:hypothetical protein